MLGKNLKYLRKKHKISQQSLADDLKIPRSTLGDYERAKTEPNIAMLIRMGDYFDTKVDQMIKEDLSHSDYEVLKTKMMRVLAISVDNNNEGNIELVDSKAEAGYLDSYHNPEYIKDLPKIHLPNKPAGTFRAFEIQGDSMLPIEPGSIIIARHIESFDDIKEDKTYIVVSQREGLVYKRVRIDKENNAMTLISDNEVFLPYSIQMEDVSELWEFYAFISYSDEKQKSASKLESQMKSLQKSLKKLEKKIK